MTPPERLPDGGIRVPRRAEGPGGIVGDGVDVLYPGDPGYSEWDEWLNLPPFPDDSEG